MEGMLCKSLLLSVALLLLGWSLLTTVRVPVAVNWKLALLAGEFGHWLALLSLVLVGLAWLARGDSPLLTGVTAVVGFGAAGFFLKPVVQAERIARALPARLTAAFGPADVETAAPFAWRRLARWPAAPVPVQTHEFAPGLSLDFYPAVGRDGRTAPCVIVIHGGGWDSGERAQLVAFNHGLARQGYAVAAISYRLAPAHPWPAQRDDVRTALAWLKARTGTLGIDATRLVLLGRSAGGQIATAVGYTGDPAIRGVVALYAVHDMRFAWSISREDDALNSLKLMRQFLGGPPEGREELYDTASGQHLVRRGVTPPTLLIHGTIDTLVWVRHSQQLAAALAGAEIPHVFIELPWATHAFEVTPGGPGGQLTQHALAHFLAVVTK